jgi:hypothetical protein
MNCFDWIKRKRLIKKVKKELLNDMRGITIVNLDS